MKTSLLEMIDSTIKLVGSEFRAIEARIVADRNLLIEKGNKEGVDGINKDKIIMLAELADDEITFTTKTFRSIIEYLDDVREDLAATEPEDVTREYARDIIAAVTDVVNITSSKTCCSKE